MANEVDISIKATDAASATMAGVGKNSESMATVVGGSLSKIGNQIGGELGEILSKGGEAFDKWGADGVSAGEKITGLGGVVAGLGLAFGALGSADKAAEQQLEAAVTAAGQSIGDYSAQIDAAKSKGEDFGHSAADVDNALAKLTESTNDVNVALEYMPLVMNLAAAKHETLTAAAQQVAQVLGGNGKVLKQYGIDLAAGTATTDQLTAALDELSNKLNGQAAAASDTFSGRIDGVKEHAEAAAASLGNELSPAFTVAGTAATILGTIVSIVQVKQDKASASALLQAEANTAEAVSADGAVESNTALAASNNAVAASATKAAAASGESGLLGTLGRLGVVGALAAGGAYVESQAYQQATTTVKQHGVALGVLDTASNVVTGGANVAAQKIVNFGKSLFGASDAAKTTATSVTGTAASAADMAVDATNATKALGTTKDALDQAGKAASTVAQAFGEVNGSAEDIYKTSLSVNDGIAALVKQVADAKDGGDKFAATLDVGTAAGRQNVESILSIIDNINQMTLKSEQAGDTTQQTSQKLDAMNGSLRTAAQGAGIGKDALQGLITQYETNPTTLSYQVTLDATNALNQIDTLTGKIAYLNGLKVTNPSAYAALATPEAKGANGTLGGYAHGGIPGAATGGNRNGVIQWAEQGDEFAKLPNGSMVLSNPDTERTLAAAGAATGGGWNGVVTLEVVGGDAEMTALIRKIVRVKGGGNAQKALGF